ncbi:MarC family protein [Aureibacter tunicatorum]|uniref:UPF0056 membrane protein n=1 Tax=Aureibacter tunicatorum TaxID=866807 RepID=A0AAE4BRT5_9BACT|nr:MarC family protein [Aureibacter tunicatorum]MDR6239021.1 multiple antibiotic resistance protein [Aureibacter tunicatorum]BDD05053.1 UPF0056 inner membrane protein [Aureibacter tunicatorum]
MNLSVKDIFSVTLILFSVIDIIGSIPIVIDLRKKAGHIESFKATLVAGVLMIAFLFFGKSILNLFGIDIGSFAIAGGIVLLLMGMEMIMGIELFKSEPEEASASSIVPLAFPLIAGAGTMTTIISLRAVYALENIIVGILLNLLFVFVVLKSSSWLERKIGPGGFSIIRKVFGIILLAIAIKLFKTHINF